MIWGKAKKEEESYDVGVLCMLSISVPSNVTVCRLATLAWPH